MSASKTERAERIAAGRERRAADRERTVTDRELLAEAEEVLTAVWKELLAIKPLLTTPYPDSPGTTPWDRRTHDVRRSAHDLSMKLRVHLKAGTVSQVALWTIYRYSPSYELYDDEAEAASMAVSMYEYDGGEHGVPMGVQYDDGQVLRTEDWPAYEEERERRRAEDAARAAAYVPSTEPPPMRAITDPFNHFAMDIPAGEPSWLGTPK